MTKLAELQANFFKDCLSGPLTENNTSMAKNIDTNVISAQGLMGIYQHSAIDNITSALSLIYPVVEKLVGEDFFKQVSRQYIYLHWPVSPNMDDYGESFPQYLADLEQVKQLSYLTAVAELEWLFHQSCLAKDSKHFDWARLARVAPADVLALKFLLAPSVALIKSTQPIDKIWQMNQDSSAQNIELSLGGGSDIYIVLFRRGLKTEIMAITASEFALLESFSSVNGSGQVFEKAIESAIAIDSQVSIDNALKKYIELGVICGFTM